MTWRTHLAVGANALWIAPLIAPIDQSMLVLIPIAIVASLLPDIDASRTGAKIHYIGGGAFGMFRGLFSGKYFHHRGLMHSFFTTLVLFVLLTIFFGRRLPALPAVFALSYFSHPLIDGFNTTVGYLYPFSRKRFALVPRSLYQKVDGTVDNLLFFLASLTFILFCALVVPQLFSIQQNPF